MILEESEREEVDVVERENARNGFEPKERKNAPSS